MTISVRDTRQSRGDRAWIESVYRDYLNDLAPLGTGMFPALPEIGHREPDQLASWFADSSAHVLTVLKEDKPVGFAMVRTGAGAAGRGDQARVAGSGGSVPRRLPGREPEVARSSTRTRAARGPLMRSSISSKLTSPPTFISLYFAPSRSRP
jgi:hypothetical protein